MYTGWGFVVAVAVIASAPTANAQLAWADIPNMVEGDWAIGAASSCSAPALSIKRGSEGYVFKVSAPARWEKTLLAMPPAPQVVGAAPLASFEPKRDPGETGARTMSGVEVSMANPNTMTVTFYGIKAPRTTYRRCNGPQVG